MPYEKLKEAAKELQLIADGKYSKQDSLDLLYEIRSMINNTLWELTNER